MKQAVKDIVGKTIQGVVVKEGSHPRSQLFLLFTDNTYYELYCPDSKIREAGGVNRGGAEEVRRYLSDHRIVLEHYEKR